MGLLDRLFPRPRPRWDWIQVEVSTACNAACAYCPRTALGSAWHSRLMDMETFARLVPALGSADMAHLQGWGEPFLNPRLPDMIRLAKQAGCRVSTTSNGVLADEARLASAVEAGLDLVALSLAGTTEAGNRARTGAPLAGVLDGLAALRRIKARRGSSAPEVHVAYMLLRSGLDELDRLPGLLAGTGVTAVVVSTLDFVPCPAMAAETLIPADPAERDRLAARLDAMGADAAAAGLAVHYRLADPEADRRGCSENVARAVVVSAEGEVAPCVYLNLAVAGEIATGGLSGGAPYRRLSFGNVREADLADIWNSPDYVRFRRDVASGRLPAPCRGCLKPSLGL